MTKFRKLVSIVLTICMAFTLLAGFEISVSAADVEVNIVSFLRGEQTDLRSSELLEARVTGYDGNVRDLTYEWTNGIKTYLYVYNNHNMYGINGTEGEIEIYNDNVESSANMEGRSYDTTFSGTGFAWAAIYGANYDNSDLLGTITVNVYDADGNLLATDSHTGTRTSTGGGWRPGSNRYTYSGFVTDDLQGDLTAIHFGIFEGDSKFIKELFSESSIVHITCTASTIDGANIVSGDDYISLVNNNDGTYTVTALEPGQAVLNMTVTKGNCKFHQYTEAEADVTVYVYKRPEPTPTTTTITLTNLDEDCTYYIDGVEGTYQEDGTVIFTNLTPNTTYTIEAKGQAEGTEAVYAYTTCTTLPVYNATVYVYLNGGWDSTTESAYGTPVNISDIRDTDDAIYIKEINSSDEFIQLTHAGTGVYTAGVPNGTYLIYRDADENSNPSTQQLIVDNADKERYLFYYSVEYDAAGGEGAPEIAYYYNGSSVNVTDVVPTRDGYRFVAWQDEDGNYYETPGEALTSSINKAYKLTAIWEEALDVYVNITIKHTANGDLGINDSETRHDITFTVDSRAEGSSEDYIELIEKTITWDGVSAVDGFSATEADYVTTYVATEPVLTNVAADMEYTFTAVKPYYEVESIEITEDADGNKIINATLVFVPDDVEFVFNVTLDDEAKTLSDELKPVAANVKVTYFDTETGTWTPIREHQDTYTKVTLDANGEGSSSHTVWGSSADGENYYYRVEVVSYVLPDGSIMAANNNGDEYYVAADERYSAYVEVSGGAVPSGESLNGAYFENSAQTGEVTAVISIEVFNVTFDPNGGQFSDGTTESKVAEDQIAIPSFDSYVVTRDDNYTFAGWFYEGTDVEATPGDGITEDVVLVAKWNNPLTIKGTVSVAGSYEQDGGVQIIHDSDRVTSVKVLLKHINDNGYEATYDSQTVEITYQDNIGVGTYEFVIPDDGHEHHVSVSSTNYSATYQNELSESTTVTDYWAYTLTHGEAEFNGDDVAVVNAYLDFTPTEFALQYTIDATAIGEGFRPENVETLVLYDDGLKGDDPQKWAVISQMVYGDEYIGQETVLTNGAGADSYDVWNSHANGYLYDYSILVQKVDGEAVDTDAAPYMIYYNGSARYSAVNGQTQILTATIVPKMYTITFDLNAGEDEVTGMDDYYNVIGAYQDTYYWSFGKAVTAKPVRENHVFLGWFDEEGNRVTEIGAAMHENVTLTAYWKELPSYVNDYAYIFGYNDTTMGAEGPLLRCELSAMVHRLVKQNGQLGDFVYDAANPSFSDIAGQWFQSGIEFMHYKGAITAPEGGNAQPYVAVTRGEAFRFICLGLGFVEDTTLTNQEYADFLYNAGYIEGDGSGDLKVADKITRAEFCTMYNRIIGRVDALLIDTDGNEVTAETYGFTDMTDKSVWYYENMVRATSAYEGDYVSIAKRGIRNVLDDYAG